MPDLERELTANRSMALELADERRLVQEGYEFLDEKRMLIANEILRRLQRYQYLEQASREAEREAQRTLLQAAGRHGMDELSVYPAGELEAFQLNPTIRRALGVRLLEVEPACQAAPPPFEPPHPSREAVDCAQAHRALLVEAARLGAAAVSLRRLGQEYRRTERRARALENVLMPELDLALGFINEQLEYHDIEEAVRVHEAHRAREEIS